jgi:hypothetical protein
MGNALDCICSRSPPLTNNPTNIHIILNKNPSPHFLKLSMKLNSSEIYFQHLYHKTKLYLINTSKIISFLNTKHLFKHFISPNTYQSNTYFTHITCSNFLSNKQYTLISLTKHKHSNELFSYRADYISTLSDQIEIKQSLISKINTYLTRDYYLVNILSFDICNQYNEHYNNYLLIFNKSKLHYEREYVIHIKQYTHEYILESDIKEMLDNCNEMLIRSIIKENVNGVISYVFVYEKIYCNYKWNYYIITLNNKGCKLDERFIEDITFKINEVIEINENNIFVCLLSDCEYTYLIFYCIC